MIFGIGIMIQWTNCYCRKLMDFSCILQTQLSSLGVLYIFLNTLHTLPKDKNKTSKTYRNISRLFDSWIDICWVYHLQKALFYWSNIVNFIHVIEIVTTIQNLSQESQKWSSWPSWINYIIIGFMICHKLKNFF